VGKTQDTEKVSLSLDKKWGGSEGEQLSNENFASYFAREGTRVVSTMHSAGVAV
jgi:hypothetical protein